MHILALETNLGKLKKQFLAEGEEELLSTTRHIFAFLIPIFWSSLLTIFLLSAGIAAIATGIVAAPLASLFLLAWLLFFLYQIAATVIHWRYHFLVVTTEKVVVIKHRSFFYQDIFPLHLENIISTRSESQFFGIGNCGTVQLTLEQKKELGSSQEVIVDYLPRPSVVAGVIENAIVLKKQRVPVDQGPQDQAQKIEDVREKTEEETKEKA